jgi:hypothetical protein
MIGLSSTTKVKQLKQRQHFQCSSLIKMLSQAIATITNQATTGNCHCSSTPPTAAEYGATDKPTTTMWTTTNEYGNI